MARRQFGGLVAAEETLAPVPFCWVCRQPTNVAYHSERWIAHLWGICHYTMVVRSCVNHACVRRQVFIRPEAEGGLAPRGCTFGLDVIAVVGQLRLTVRCSAHEIHRRLVGRGVGLAQRTVTELAHRYAGLMAPAAADPAWLVCRLRRQDRVVLAVDGVRPEQEEPTLWVLRDVLSGTLLLARSLRGARGVDLQALIGEAAALTPLPIVAVLYSGPDGGGAAPRQSRS